MSALNIEQKQDSPEKLVAVLGKETKYYLFANEFNALVDKVKELEARVVPNGKFTIYKNPLNTNPANALLLEIGDVATGFLANGSFICPGKYLGGDIQDLANWDTGAFWIPE